MVLADRPDLTREQLERTRSLMNQVGIPRAWWKATKSWCPPSRFRTRMTGTSSRAAVVAKASTIVTFNLSDFPNARVVTLPDPGRFIQTPFSFSLLKQEPAAFLEGLRQHLGLPAPKTSEEYLEGLRRTGLCGCPRAFRGKDLSAD